MVDGAARQSKGGHLHELKIGRINVALGAVGLVLAALLALVDWRTALSTALCGLFLLSLGGRVAFAEGKPATERLFTALAALLPPGLLASIVEQIANAR